MGLGAMGLLWARGRLVVVTVDGTSMMPALDDGDRVLVRRRSIGRLRHGDVVVLEPPFGRPLSARCRRVRWADLEHQTSRRVTRRPAARRNPGTADHPAGSPRGAR
ncbi:MAG: S24/S26 family peptidase [Spirillospora sp.]